MRSFKNVSYQQWWQNFATEVAVKPMCIDIYKFLWLNARRNSDDGGSGG
jgi:hypothetical protein